MAGGHEGSHGFVLCVGMHPSDGLAIAELVGRRGAVVIVADVDAARTVLDCSFMSTAPAAASAPESEFTPISLPVRHVVESGPLSLDLDCHVARWDGREFELHGLEFDLLATLASQAGRVWTFEDLTSRVWSHRYLGDPSAVASAVKRLRRRLREQRVSVEIESVRGLGFRLATLPRPRNHNGHELALPSLD